MRSRSSASEGSVLTSCRQVDSLLESIGATRKSALDYAKFEKALARRLIDYGVEQAAGTGLDYDVQAGLALMKVNPDGGVDVAHVRTLLTTSGGMPLTGEEADALLALADPEGVGCIPFERMRTLPCWARPTEDRRP